MFSLGKCVLVLCAAVAANGFSLGPTDIIFHLFTRSNPQVSQPIFPSINSILAASLFNPEVNTVITVHSNGEDVTGNFNAFVVTGHLQAENVNVLAVDWSKASSMYTEGLANAEQVGKVIADFINILSQSFSYMPSQVRIVGVGLGGHIAGIAGRNVIGNLPYIVAIDPSLHGWTHNPLILNKDDADVVEVLHATAGVLGYDFPLGDIDFYPNGGTYQFGCGIDSSCSLTYGIAFYAESVTRGAEDNEFVGTKCENYEEAIAQECAGARDAVFGGLESKTGASGVYSFKTNMVQPFAQG
ncbi:inactive pancreatic lipase-related protein 1-like [Trichoplusia ni]|uniref:Inactive pancreatic lipase-related protein 1-like n=1 Tax=Trichoplusia ni TaxID=7111 RepID=A0A7E5VT08_TRINI|nr:inactive pancreatic lipase-related protein 1-like [Trichoplusia ni]